MTDGDRTQLKVRLTPEMKAWLERRAEENCRPLTREIEHRLLESRRQEEQPQK